MNKQTLARASSALCVCAMLCGCQNELFSKDEEITGPRTSTKDVGSFDAAKQSEIPPQTLEEAVAQAHSQGFTPPTYAAKTEVTITDVRVMALANNLDLRVVQFDPAVGVTRINEELAKFEAVLNASYTKNTTGLLTQLEEGVSTDATNANLGVSVPLATGGTISTGTLINQADQGGVVIPGFEPYEAGLQLRKN